MKANRSSKLALAKKLQVASEAEHLRILALQAQLAEDAARVEEVRVARLKALQSEWAQRVAQIERERVDKSLRPLWRRVVDWWEGR